MHQLPVMLQKADGSVIKLADLRNRPLLITMFYSHCTAVCPLLTAQLQRLLEPFSHLRKAKATSAKRLQINRGA